MVLLFLGTFSQSDGSKYEGEFQRGKPNGRGVFIFANGSRYTGLFKDDQFHDDSATYESSNGDVYVGAFRVPIFFVHPFVSSVSPVTRRSPSFSSLSLSTSLSLSLLLFLILLTIVLSVILQEGEKNGKGTLKSPRGFQYNGDFVNGQMEGYGEYVFDNGDMYKGTLTGEPCKRKTLTNRTKRK